MEVYQTEKQRVVKNLDSRQKCIQHAEMEDQSGQLLRVFVFEGPSSVFTLIHYNGGNPVVRRHLPTVNLKRHPDTGNRQLEWS